MGEERATRRLAPSFLPTTAVLEMTYRCNHACRFCSCPWYAQDGKFDVRTELNTTEWQRLIARLCELGCNSLAFTGGEPLLKEGIEEIIAFAARCQVEHIDTQDGVLASSFGPPKLYLLSNGKAMSDAILQLCRQHQINLSLSLPGLTTFTDHIQSDTSPDHILQWFHKAHQLGIGTTVGITVTRQNLFELYETIAQALLAGADTLLLNRFLPGGRGLQYASELNIGPAQIVEMIETADTVLQEANRNGSVGTELPKCMIANCKTQRLTVGTRCAAAISFFVVDPSGYVRVCNHSPIRLNHIDELLQVKYHPYWKRFVMKEYLPHACGKCKLMSDCDGGCREAAHIVGGQVDSMDPVLA